MTFPLTGTPMLRRSAPVVAMTAFLLGATLLLAVAVLFPMSDGAPIEEGRWAIVLALALAGATWFAGDRLPHGWLLGEAVFVALCQGLLTAVASTPAGALADGMAFAVLAVYVGVFFPRSATWFGGLAFALFGLGLLATGLPGLLTGWLVVGLTIWGLAAGLGLVSGGLQRRVETDRLTGALNRDGLDAVAAHAFARARRRSEPLSVAVLDLDGFKQVNDSEGHASGDRLLADATHAWRGALRGEDVLARMGGDEFVLLLPGTEPDEADPVLERLREAHPVAWTAGVAAWRPGETLASCVDRADQRLYEAKGAR
jgi:diguanylate cyclase (GGDEF)-like protein